MHIPDGYLSPSTCAVLYAGAGVGWYGAMRRVKRVLNTRMIPLISVFAAFSFLLMMFNLPLPGGTTGHALGVAISSIVLGPSGSILAISIALAIQALFFGDGGITTLGANCFNMATIGSLVAYAAYRLISNGAAIGSRRRVVAGAVAGYLAVNAAAFLAAVEFGIQPTFFHDSQGAPLYAPYPLHIAIPAMMIGHLAVAGIAEAVITAGLIAYLQSADSALLQRTAGMVPGSSTSELRTPQRPFRRLWLGVALLLLLTPLGILAAGTAWGEWHASEFSSEHGRNQIANASGQQPPAAAPEGLQRLSTIWTAPLPAYAPQYVKSRSLGYLLSAMFGVGLLLTFSWIVQTYVQRWARGRTV